MAVVSLSLSFFFLFFIIIFSCRSSFIFPVFRTIIVSQVELKFAEYATSASNVSSFFVIAVGLHMSPFTSDSNYWFRKGIRKAMSVNLIHIFLFLFALFFFFPRSW